MIFHPEALPKTSPLPAQTLEQLQRLEAQLRERDEKLSVLLADKTALDAELTRLRAEVAAAKKANAVTPRHARLLRGRDTGHLHRPPAQGSGLAARSAA
jgi:septal ring factor EnvC (AmiA/AmiB activator)